MKKEIEFGDLNMEIVYDLCMNFSERAKEKGANTSTMLLAAIRIFMTILKYIVVPDPDTGRKYERILMIVPKLIHSYNKDFPIDKEDKK